MKTKIATYLLLGFALCFNVEAKPKKHHPTAASEIGITIHLPSDGAFQFYTMKQCGGTPSNPDNYVEWDHEIWPSRCYPTSWSRAAYGYIQLAPVYNPQWVEWIPGNDSIIRDFCFVAPTGFWTNTTFNYVSEFDTCGNYRGEFLDKMQVAGYPANATYWVDFDSTGSIRISVGAKPAGFDSYFQNGSANPTPRTEELVFMEDASALPNYCP